MTWQILLGIHLLFSTAYALLLRQLASEVKGYARLVSAIMYVFVVLPGGVAVALVLGDISFRFSPAVIGILLLAGVLFAITNIAAYRANEELDAAQFSIITNLESFFTIMVAGLFLGERLSFIEVVGVVLLVASAIMITVERVGKKTFRITKGSWTAIISSIVLAGAVTAEKYLLGQMNLASYMIVGWGLQTASMVWLAFPERGKLKSLKPKQLRHIALLGFMRLGVGLAFIKAIQLVDVSVLSSARSYKPVLVFIFALLVLHERKHFWRKLFASILATIGLLLLI